MQQLMGQGHKFGEYELTGECFQGSMSYVFVGKHLLDGTTVAIKILRNNPGQNSLQLIEEGKILSLLCHQNGSHENIVAFKEQSQEEGKQFISMGFVSNRSLRTLIGKRQTFPLRDLLKYVNQVADALQFAHERHIIHCDIKPEHMLLLDTDDIVLCDFGHAIQLPSGIDQLPLPINHARNSNYLAPEQIGQNGQNGYHCYASDQYALGLVVYELLCGKLPEKPIFQTQTIKEWDIAPFGSMRIGFVNVLAKALSENPQARYESIQGFAKALTEEARKSPNFVLPTPKSTSSLILLPDNQSAPSAPPLKVLSSVPSNISHNSSPIVKANFSRRTLFMLIGAATFGFLGVSWVEVEPQIAQIIAPRTNPPKFGTIYYTYYGHRENVNGIAWSPSGKRIASGSFDRTIQIWDALDGANRVILQGNMEHINDVAWSPKGTHIASCSGSGKKGKDNTVRVWDTTNGQTIFTTLDHKDVVNAVTWSPDGTMIASASFDGTVIVWDARTGDKLHTYSGHIYKGHINPVFDVAWSPDGRYIASCSKRPLPEVHIWDAVSMNTKVVYTGHSDDVFSISWGPTGNTIISGSQDKSVRTWSTDDGTDKANPRLLNAPVRKVSWSPQGKYIAVGTSTGDVYVWVAPMGTEIYGSPQNPYREQNQSIFGTPVVGVNTPENNTNLNALAWSPDSTMIAIAGGDSSVYVWSSGLQSGV